MAARAHDAATTSGAITIANAVDAVNNARGWEIRRLDDIDQVFQINRRVFQHAQTRINRIGQIVRRNIGGHTDRNAGRAIDQQVRETRRQHQRFHLLAVVVGAEIDGIGINIGHQFRCDFLHAALGITHRSSIVAIDRTEITLAIDQHVAQ